MCTHTNFYVSQLLYLDICQVCIMLLTGHRFPRNHISLNLFHYAWHNLFSHCQKEGFIYPTMMWNLSVITCNCNRLQNTTHSSWTDLSYLKHHHWQDINRGYFKGTCYAGGKKKPNQTKQKKPKQKMPRTLLNWGLLSITFYTNLFIFIPADLVKGQTPLPKNSPPSLSSLDSSGRK